MNTMKAATGRPKRSLNKNTVNGRKAIANFVEMNIPKFNGWLEQIALGIPKVNQEGKPIMDEHGAVVWTVKPSPLDAMKIVADVAEYHLPKLSRQDVQISGAVATVSELSPVGQAMLSMSGDALEAHLRSLTLADQVPAWLMQSTVETIDCEAILVPENKPDGDEPK